MRRLTDLDPGRRAAQERAAAFNARVDAVRTLDHERQMRHVAERKLAERHHTDSARFSQLATEQAMRELGREIGKRFARRLEEIGQPTGEARLMYHIADQAIRGGQTRMLPPEYERWFYEIMEQAQAYVEPRVGYVSRGDQIVDIQESIRVEVIWPRDVLAYSVTLGR